MRKYRVSPELKKYVRRVLHWCYCSCRMETADDGTIWCYTNASSNTFHKIVQRAKCLKRGDETGLCYLTSEECKDPYIVEHITRYHDGKGSFVAVIDDKDGSKVCH